MGTPRQTKELLQSDLSRGEARGRPLAQRIARLLERLLATGRTGPPVEPETVDAALARHSLPACPAYRALLERTDGLVSRTAEILGVGDGEMTIDAEAPTYAPLIPLVLADGLRWGWHTADRAWVCEAAFARVDTYRDDAEMINDAYAQSVKGYVPRPQPAPDGPTLADLEAAHGQSAPAEAALVRKARMTFKKRNHLESMPAELAALLERHDGLVAGDLQLHGTDALLAEPDPAWFLRVGTLGDRVLGRDLRERQWKVLAADLDTVTEHPRFEEFSALVAFAGTA